MKLTKFEKEITVAFILDMDANLMSTVPEDLGLDTPPSDWTESDLDKFIDDNNVVISPISEYEISITIDGTLFGSVTY